MKGCCRGSRSEASSPFEAPVELVLDTHAIKELLLKPENKWILDAVKRKCHFLVVPDLPSEHRVRIEKHFKHFPTLLVGLRTKLRGKFLPHGRPSVKLPKDVRSVLRRCKAEKGDFFIAGVAIRRARRTGRRVIIVSNNKCFHLSSPSLHRHNIYVMHVEHLLHELKVDDM